MKSLRILMLLFGLPLFLFGQEPIVKAKTKLNSDFFKYRSFAWTETAAANNYIKDAIEDELLARGYEQNDAASDLIVSYRVLDKKTRVHGFVNDFPTVVGGEEFRAVDDTTSFVLEPGTLMISMIDRKTSQVVWDGFASGLSKPDSFAARPEKAREVVRKIFDEFKHRTRPVEN